MFTLYLFRCSSMAGALLHHGCLLLEEPAAAGFAVRLKKSIFICLHVTGNLHFFHALLQSQEEMRAVFYQKGCSWMSVAAISSVLGGKSLACPGQRSGNGVLENPRALGHDQSPAKGTNISASPLFIFHKCLSFA